MEGRIHEGITRDWPEEQGIHVYRGRTQAQAVLGWKEGETDQQMNQWKEGERE